MSRLTTTARQIKELEKRLKQSRQAVPGVLLVGAFVLLALLAVDAILDVPWLVYVAFLWVVPFGLIGDGVNILCINRKLKILRSRADHEKEMRERANEARVRQWSLQRWSRSPALVTQTDEGTVVERFVGQEYDSATTKLVEDGWDHDHCLFCWASICNCGGKNCATEGYTDGREWVCPSCYKRVIVRGQEPTT